MAMERRWATFNQTGALLPLNSNSGPVAVDLFSGIESAIDTRITPCTVTRIVGSVQALAAAEGTAVPGTGGNIHYGIAVISRTLMANSGPSTPNADLPDPEAVGEEGWLWRFKARLSTSADQPNSQAYPYSPERLSQFSIDIRAQRKVSQGQTLAFIAHSDWGSTHEPNVFPFLRTLTLY